MRRKLLAALMLAAISSRMRMSSHAGELPAPPTAAQAFTGDQLLKWIAALPPLARETLEARLPATFAARQETRFRVSWQADVSRVRAWFTEVEFIEAGDAIICRFGFRSDNPITRAQAQAVFGNFEPLPPPSPPIHEPGKPRVDNPVFSRVYLRTRLSNGSMIRLVFEPLERGGMLHEITLVQPATR